MKIRERNSWIVFFLVSVTVILVAVSYYSAERYVGDTALYAQITENIAYTGKAESNILASTQDFIDRAIAAMPVEERISDESTFIPQEENTRNILKFHSCLILYLIAPLCYIMSPFACVTLAQSVALAFSLMFIILILREKKIPVPIIVLTSILLISHPGWSFPAISGAFYPERLFMGTGMYLVWSCEKEKFDKVHFIIAAVLCAMVGERGALYAGMFILAHTFFYWKENKAFYKWKLVVGTLLVSYAGVMIKAVLSNLYYSDIGGKLQQFLQYLSVPQNLERVWLFLIINVCLFLVISIYDWRAFIIGFCAMIPNLIYDNGGSEKIGWTLHYHVFYFVFLMWAVTKGIIKICKVIEGKSNKKTVWKFSVMLGICIWIGLLNMVNPYDTQISFSTNNLKNNVVVKGIEEIKSVYMRGGGKREIREDFNKFVKLNILEGSTVSTVEGGMCVLAELKTNIYIFPMGVESADAVLITYLDGEAGYQYSGSVGYWNSKEEQQLFDQAVVEKLKEFGYNVEEPALYPAYGIAIIKKE